MKDCNYYSEQEDNRFSKIVIEYNLLNDGEEKKEALRAMVRDRTQILLYQLPIRALFLTEDEASEIYLASLDRIDEIISSYTKLNSTYNSYLTTICKYSAMSLYRARTSKSTIEEGYNAELSTAHSEAVFNDIYISVAEREPFYGEQRPEIFSMDITKLIDYISHSLDNYTEKALTAEERELSQELRSKNNRRRMMIYLLSLPQIESPRFIDSISRIMQLDTMVFSYFYSLRFELLEDINKRWEIERDKSNRHFKTLLRLRAKLLYETDSLKLEELNNTYSRIYAHYTRKLELARKLKRGLTQNEIAKALGIKRSAVCYAISHTKALMQEIVGEI